MSKNLNEIPYTEIFERVVELGRISPNAYAKVRGVIQDVYLRDIAIKHDWNFLLTESSLVTTQQYNTGTVSINTGSTTATFSSDVVLDGSFTGRKIKFQGGNAVYDLTFTATTSGSVNPAFQGDSNISGGTYTIYSPFYALAGNFGRFPKEGGVFKWEGGKKRLIREESFHEQSNEFQSTPTTTPDRVRLVSLDTAGNQLIELRPPVKNSQVIGYNYFKKLSPMTESTAGTILSTSASSTVVTGNTNTRFTEALTDGTYYFRVDALGRSQDSSWYPILAVAHNSLMTLGVSFANTAITSSATYTISRIPEMPYIMHPAVVYGALESMSTDQNDPAVQVYRAKYAQVLSDSKRLYVSRVYNQKVETIAEDYRYRR